MTQLGPLSSPFYVNPKRVLIITTESKCFRSFFREKVRVKGG